MKHVGRWLCAIAVAAAGAGTAEAASLSADGHWHTFDVSDVLAVSGGTEWIDVNDGTPLAFTFIIPTGNIGRLTIVDTVFAGDTFSIFDGLVLLGTTSAVPAGMYTGQAGLFDPDQALANPLYSRGTFVLAAGSYHVSGRLQQSVLDAPGGAPLNSTSGSLRLDQITAIPEPGSMTLVLSGLGMAVARLRRHRASASSAVRPARGRNP